jgi:hypothetical protein
MFLMPHMFRKTCYPSSYQFPFALEKFHTCRRNERNANISTMIALSSSAGFEILQSANG